MLKDMIKARPTSRGMYSGLVSILVLIPALVLPSQLVSSIYQGTDTMIKYKDFTQTFILIH